MPKNAMILMGILLLVSIIMGGCGMMQGQTVSNSEKYPAKPITIIVPFSAGGSTDFLARTMEKTAVKHLGQPLVIVNKPGGGATIGWNELAGSQPDGYTVGIIGPSLVLQPLYGTTKYHYPSALEPIAQIATSPTIMAVRADQSWQTLQDLIAYAKAHPGIIKYGHPGLGATSHVVAETFAKEAGIKIEQVPFLGGAEAIGAVLGGHIQLLVTVSPSDIKEHVKSGKLRVLAISAEKRLKLPEFSQVPTFKEQGFDITFAAWQGVGAPKGLPEQVKRKLAEGFKEIINEPDFIQKLEQVGLTVEYLGPQELSDKLISENTRLTKIIKETGIAERIAAQKK